MTKPVLYIFSGLPGSGKSTLAKQLARHLEAAHIRIDSIEQGLRDICGIKEIEDKGYCLAYTIAKDILAAGLNAVADSVNPLEATRKAWMEAARSTGAGFVNIEVLCSDPVEHRHRVESRESEIANLKLPTWEQVFSREYDPWKTPRVQIDTAGKSIEECLRYLSATLQNQT